MIRHIVHYFHKSFFEVNLVEKMVNSVCNTQGCQVSSERSNHDLDIMHILQKEGQEWDLHILSLYL